VKILTKEQFESLSLTPTDCIKVETPQEDVRIVEELLDIPRGTLSPLFVSLREGSESCTNCGRRFSLLDQVSTGLTVHGKQFIKDIITGTYGYVLNSNPPQMHNCYGCGVRGNIAFRGYNCAGYGCS
jgi:hypothetical protein